MLTKQNPLRPFRSSRPLKAKPFKSWPPGNLPGPMAVFNQRRPCSACSIPHLKKSPLDRETIVVTADAAALAIAIAAGAEVATNGSVVQARAVHAADETAVPKGAICRRPNT